MSDVAVSSTPSARVRAALATETCARICSVVCALIGWEILAALADRVPGIADVVSVLADEMSNGELVDAFAVTLQRFFAGLALAFVSGVALGVLLGLSSWVRALLGDIVVVSVVIPGVIWALLCVLWFGFGFDAPVAAAVLTTVPFIALNVLQGVQGVPADLLRMSKAFGVPWHRRVLRLVLPAVTDYLIIALRFAIIMTWNLVLLTEWFGGTEGVGFRTRYFYDQSAIDGFVAWIVFFIGFIVLLDRLVVEPLASRALRWRTSTSILPTVGS